MCWQQVFPAIGQSPSLKEELAGGATSISLSAIGFDWMHACTFDTHNYMYVGVACECWTWLLLNTLHPNLVSTCFISPSLYFLNLFPMWWWYVHPLQYPMHDTCTSTISSLTLPIDIFYTSLKPFINLYQL